jgi:hypothetical protein
VGTITDIEAAGAFESYMRGLSVDQIANGARFYGRVPREEVEAAITARLEARERINVRLRELAQDVRRYADRPCVIFGTPTTLAEICRLLGFKNSCRKGSVYLTPTKIQRLGMPLSPARTTP